MTITLQLFRRFRFCSTRRLLPGVLAALFLAAIGCGHGKIRSTQTRVSPAVASETKGAEAMQAAAGFDKFFLHDDCTAQYPPQPDTCLHDRLHQQSFTFGGKAGTIYDVTLHIRGIFEPTIITSGETPDAQHPYFKVGGTVSTPDWSQWAIEVSEPKQTYWLNHYPSVGHTIYKEDFEATIIVAAGATVLIRVTDGNDRQIDNGKTAPDRQQIIAGAVDHPLAGQMLRIDVVRLKTR
jgi:hypothetical protein